MFTSPTFTSTTSLDYAETNPSVMVRAGNFTDSDRPNDSHAAFSTDGGANWFQGTEPGGINEGGTIAAAADGSRFMWAPANSAPVYSVGFGNSWTQSTGLPQNAIVESDRVNANTFYGFSGGRFYVSTNGGASFAATAASGLPSSGHFKAVPGHAGDVWLAGGAGVWHSTDFGSTFTKLANVQEADNIGFGKAAPGRTYQALYTIAKIDNVRGIFRSDDMGASWIRINDDQHQWGNIGQALTGDPRIYGRVYVGTNGRGILYGDTSSTSTSPPPVSTSPSQSRSASPSPSVSPSASRTSSPPPTGACTVTYSITGQWQGGFQASVKITNGSSAAVNGWSLKWAFANGQVISQLWNGVVSQSGANVTVTNADYNRVIPGGGGTAEVGFLASWTGTNTKPTAFTLNGSACATG